MNHTLHGLALIVLCTVSRLGFAEPTSFSVSSPDFGPERPIPGNHLLNQYGCTGLNRSPALQWLGAPSGTKSFAITMFDPDEHGTPSGWWHWVVYDIPKSATHLPENAGSERSSTLPLGSVQGRTDMAQDAYHGPCPGKGEPPHHYVITIYALSVEKLPVPPEASGAMVTWVAHDYTLAKAVVTARYGR
jgi:Raf kinase inhibitor-like YbhB/YbcL family protein